jgi:uncharacterized membrane protein YgcG
LALLAAALAVAIGLLSACGGGGGQDVDKVLNQTFNGKKKVNSGQLDMNVSANLQGLTGLNGPVTLKMGGQFDGLQEKIRDTNRLPRAQLAVKAGAGGQSFEAGATSTGDKLFIDFMGTNYAVPDKQFGQLKRQLQDAQIKADRSKDPDLAELGVHPREWLKNPDDKGTEDIGGTPTIHVSSDVNVPKMLADFDALLKRTSQLRLGQQQQQQLPNGLPASVRNQIAESVKDAKLDLFTGKNDKILRRLEVRVKFELSQKLRQQANGLKNGDVTFTYQVTDINAPQTITAPKSAKPLSDLQRQLQNSGFGALGGSAGGSSSSGGGTTGGGGSTQGATSAQARKYLRCVRKASGKSELNRCAELLK